MKNKLIVLFSFLLLVAPHTASAQEKIPVSLTIPAGFTSQTCPRPMWKDVSVYWKGVVDERTAIEIGSQEKKGVTVTQVVANPSLDRAFDEALTQLLPACGLRLKREGFEEDLWMEIRIEQFFAGEQKKFLTGTSEANSRLLVLFGRDGETTQSVDIGFTIESKKVRKKSIKQLEVTLNELFTNTLKQLVESRYLQDLK